MFETTIILLTVSSGFLVVYAHILFPLILKKIQAKAVKKSLPAIADYPEITIIVPAYNEAAHIADKIINIAALDYPTSRLKLVVYCDGCTDDTARVAEKAIFSHLCQDLEVELIESDHNMGKIAALNHLIPKMKSEIIALSDVSALLSIDALRIAAAHFQDDQTGFVAGTYDFANYGSTGEETYWRYQRGVKQGEAALGAPIGCHGAFYLFRRDLFHPLPADTVNDDFILPMEIIGQGYDGVYEPDIMALELELEQADTSQDFTRRIRISTGNVQQVLRLSHLLNPKYGGVALGFFSGKALRAFMAPLLAVCFFGSLILSFSEDSLIAGLFGMGFAAQAMVYVIALGKPVLPKHKMIDAVAYIISGYLAGLIGLYRFVTGKHKGKWERAAAKEQARADSASYVPVTVRVSKRAFDICAALGGLIILSPLFPILAVMIKMDSAGPVIFKQKRVGMATANFTRFFNMYKFRTMVQDAEKMTGAVWAQKDDPRITRMGKFMRKTRLDELPQLWNILIGDMSLIGPRPERPELYGKLNREVPFFAERNYGVRPGITGPAQIHNGYDETIEDVRNKAAYDHSYALSLVNFRHWMMGDAALLFQTVGVVVGQRGQ